MGDRFQPITKKQSRFRKSFKLKVGEEDEEMGKPRSDQSPSLSGSKERKSKRERWLLTRKTWRYMADAGRKLIPEGVHNRQEDIPKIEAYFQEVCQREPRFLLWRKSSYPGALGLRSHGRRSRSRKKTGSYREKANSADEAEEVKKIGNPCGGGLFLTPTSAGRFDLHKMAQAHKEFEETVEEELLKDLENYLEPKEASKQLNHQELLDKLQRYMEDLQKEARLKHRTDVGLSFRADPQHQLLNTLRRYYNKSPNREHVISNLLTDRKMLEKLYFELRRTRGFVSGRRAGSAYFPEWRSGLRRRVDDKDDADVERCFSPPPVIEIEPECVKMTRCTQMTQIPPDVMKIIEEKLKAMKIEEEAQQKSPKEGRSRRRSSVDHDDVSPSVSDTIKRYLKMARKKSIDSEKFDRFKTINYDKNLRNIKAKGEPMPGDDDGLNKGAQTDESWTKIIKELKIEIPTDPVEVYIENREIRVKIPEVESAGPSSRSSCESLLSPTQSKSFLSSGQTFLSNLLHGLQDSKASASVLPIAMQKSKSSSSVGRSLVSKKIWRGRSKSQGRITTAQPSSWTPQGNCMWRNVAGRQVTLTDTSLVHLTEVERKLLQKVALSKLQALNLGCQVNIPSEAVGPSAETKPKRRPHLLKRKAITTSFFDTSRTKDKEVSGLVFGVPLTQCVENERVKNPDSFPDDPVTGLSRKSEHSSRISVSSLVEPRITSHESGGSSESLGGSVPGLLDTLSVGSAADVSSGICETEPGVPHVVSSCIRHLENHGLHTLGIFRVSSSKKRVRQLREDFDSGKDTLTEDCCPHDVATLLKEYFRDLPEPLLSTDLYHAFIHTQKIRNRRLQFEALQHLIQLLPGANRDTLWCLLNFLSVVAANSDDTKDRLGGTIPGNKMDSNNLATLFAPNILHNIKHSSTNKDQLSAESTEERTDVINVIRCMIDHNKDLFQVPAELLDEVYVHMMDSSPDSLDQLLRRRDPTVDEILDDPDSGILEEVGTASESSSIAQTPKSVELQEVVSREEKRYYSREQFFHGLSDNDSGRQNRDRDRFRDSIQSLGLTRIKDSEATSLGDVIGRGPEDDSRNTNVVVDSTGQSSSGVIKASLTIPTASFSLGLDDGDIPFIEDSGGVLMEGSKHQMTIEVVRSKPLTQTSVVPRYRTTSGSDSSQASTPIQPITGSISLVQGGGGGYDSAVGSSATFSSPPRNTTTPSVCSSSDREYFSSPPSWASSPPLSPDSQTSLISYQLCTEETQEDTVDVPVVRMTLPSVKTSSTKNKRKDSKKTKEPITKSASASQLTKKDEQQPDTSDWSRRVTTSISNIGGAVMRSKTADIERMLKIKSKTAIKTGERAKESEEKKKYVKRRYTDSRHETKTIVNLETEPTSRQPSVWKRKEIISSPLKDEES